MMKKITTSLLLILLFSACSKQENFVHSIKSTEGIQNAELNYAGNSPQTLKDRDIQLKRTETEVDISVKDDKGTSIFKDIPAKYINIDANVEITRNVFHDYFHEEWKAMKDVPFTSIYIKSKKDNQVFFMKTVYTGTDKEIGKYSESF